jgi:DNA-binding winged helix-turn-helix (wHTH) protein/TolB-like protein
MYLRFGPFLFDAARLELSRDGRPVRLQPQPAQVLATLLARAGTPVTRDELRQAVWRDDTFVDFDRGLNFCIAQIRAALEDDAAAPRFVRTLPKLGYEFIGAVEKVDKVDKVEKVEKVEDVENVERVEEVGAEVVPIAAPVRARRKRVFWSTVAAAVALTCLIASLPHFLKSPEIVAVARFDNDTDNAALAPFIDALTDAVVEKLTGSGADRYLVVGNAALLRKPRDERDLVAIGSSLNATFVVLGQIQKDDERVRVLAHLIRLPDQTHIVVSRTDQLEIAGSTLTLVDELSTKIVKTIDSGIRIGKVGKSVSREVGK